MFSQLTDSLESTLKNLRGQGKLTEENVAESLREVRRAFLEADVNFNVTRDFVKAVKEKALGSEVLTSVTPGQQIVKIIHDELVNVMGGETKEINLSGPAPVGIMMAGLQGSGKTTFAGKIALWMRSKKKRKPLLVAADVYRPAAIKQLQVLGKSIGIPVYDEAQGDPVEIIKHGYQYAKDNGFDLVIYDTAGRLQIDEELMQELEKAKEAVHPDEILFVADAMIGQEAVNVAETFWQRLNFTGVCLSKMDGDTRGGAALSIRTVVTKPIKFVGTGEKMDAIDVFYPTRMADRILGMGDVVSLVERAQQQFDEEKAKELERKIRKNKFDFDDFLGQIEQIQKMGNLKDLASMIPGMGKALKDVEIDDNAFKGITAIIHSMTPYERAHPDVLNQSRRMRIAKGSGTNIQEVNRLIKQFDQTRKMMKMVTDQSRMGMMMKGMKAMRGMKGGMPKM